jgi:predicted nucleic acid-binding protein
MRLIVDVSVAIGWVVPLQSSPVSTAARKFAIEHGALVPFHFHIELLNALLALERRQRMTAGAVNEALQMYEQLELDVDEAEFGDTQPMTFTLARKYVLTAFDAAYLELALRSGLPLATRDQPLAIAGKKAGAKLLEN